MTGTGTFLATDGKVQDTFGRRLTKQLKRSINTSSCTHIHQLVPHLGLLVGRAKACVPNACLTRGYLQHGTNSATLYVITTSTTDSLAWLVIKMLR